MEMKLSLKLTALLMALLMLLSIFALTSCDNTQPPVTGDETTTPVSDTTVAPDTTADTTTAAEASSDLVMMQDGASFVTIIRDEDAKNGDMEVECATDLRKHIENKTGLSPKISTDWIKAGQEYDSETLEILVGNTGYNESATALAGLAYGEYLVKVIGNKLVLAAYSDDALYEAFRVTKNLINQNSSKGSLVIPADTELRGTTSTMLDSLPIYEDATFSSTYECGGDAMLVIMNDTDMTEFNKYMTKLEGAGWTQYTTNTFGENKFATYTTDKYTINAGYYNYENAARIIIEPLAKPVGLESDNKYEKVTTSQITMLGVEYINSSTKEYVSNGLSMLIRLEDGRFVIVDGAFNSNAGSKSADLLINELKEQSKDYLKPGEKITVAAWIITHAHGDHYGMINKHYSKFASMKVEKFFVNFLSETERARAINSSTYGKNWSATEGSTWTQLITAAKALKADVQYVHVGQVFYMADLRMDILYTIESFAPKTCNALNTSSLTIKMTFNTGDTFLMTGDTTGNGMEIAAKTFGDYMQCDMLQVSHHGGTTWGNDSGMIYAYNLVAPTVLLWPRGMNNFDAAKNKNYNKVLFSPDEGGKNKNFKELFVSGFEGDKILLPIPYTVGNATEIRVGN